MIPIPGFTLKSRLYDSQTSLVYRAVRQADSRAVVLKVLRQEYPSPEAIARYRQEYAVLRSLSLPGVIQAYDQVPYAHTYVIVCEDFGGQALSHWMRQWPQIYCPMQTAGFLKLAITLADILHQVHTRQVVHNDINPSNIVLNPATGQIKLIDFGLATQLCQTAPAPAPPGQLEGTPAYMSPEQTGRMNRSIDYRTDLYSLGVTFYHLLTGRLPFPTEDLLELVHGHLAILPLPPSDLNPTIAPVLSALVLKLMAKNADDRYQSAAGLKADLVHALKLWQATGTVADFPLAQQDFTGKLQISQKLYGREEDVAKLLVAFERVATGESGRVDPPAASAPSPYPELLLITGYSGIGKSALVQDLYRPITQQGGYFISGKFDQYQRNIPYTAIVEAFGGLVRQILGESEAALQRWRDRILAAVGPNGGLIVEVLPEVGHILGDQPEVPQLGALESQNRFNYVFQNFVRVFCRPEHPLTVFLDDLQWADTASLNLLQRLLCDRTLQHVLVLGAYRANEVNQAHPLTLMLGSLKQAGGCPQTLVLEPLTSTQVGQLLSDTLNQPVEAIAELTHWVMQKTTGNPFFINQFLRTLYSRGLLTFDGDRRRWQWDIAHIETVGFTDNVVALMVESLRELPADTQRLLQWAACLGAEFEGQTLAQLAGQSADALLPNLAMATQQGLLLPLRDQTGTRYRFAHDQVQQAVYEGIDPPQRCRLHLQIGHLLWQETAIDKLSDRLFAIADQFNLGLQAVELAAKLSGAERQALADLNLQAAVKAKTSLAYDAALAYGQSGLALLGVHPWRKDYRLALALYEAAAEAAYLSGNMAQTERYFNAVLAQATTPLDTVRSYDIKIQALASQGNLQGAIAAGLTLLAALEIYLPQYPTVDEAQGALLHLNTLLADRNSEELLKLPTMQDAVALAAVQVLAKIASAAYISTPNLLPLILLKIIELSLQYGHAQGSTIGYVGYASFNCGILGQIETGYRFGQLASQLVTQLQAHQFQAKVFNVVGGHVIFWREPLRNSRSILLAGYDSGIATGDFEYAGYALFHLITHLYFSGEPLSDVIEPMQGYVEAIRQIRQDVALGWASVWLQSTLNLVGQAHQPTQLIGPAYDETTALPLAQHQGNRTELHHSYLAKLMLCYWFGEYDRAAENADLSRQYLDAVGGMVASAVFCFYDSLVQLALPADVTDLDQVNANLEKLHLWAAHAPMNGLHKVHLVEAEKARRLGQALEAEDYYERAIAGAKANQYRQDEALAFELAGQFYLERGRDRIAATYLQEAHYTYRLWGAAAKVHHLEAQYPSLVTRNLQPSSRQPTEISQTSLTSQRTLQQAMDLQAVFRAAQAISSEIEMPRLLSSLMKTLLEIAGAQRGCIALPIAPEAEPDAWFIEAVGSAESADSPPASLAVDVLQHLPLDGQLPLSLINTVLRCRDSIVLDDAAQNHEFAADPYLQAHSLRSVLCAPLVNQGIAVGLVYLENNLTPAAFTVERLEVVKLLSGQAAISIYNAKLYGQLRQSEAQVRQSEQRVKQFLDAIPVGVSVLDRTGRFAYTNAKAEMIQGIGSPGADLDRMVEDFHIYRADTDERYPVQELPAAKALAGEMAYADDIELRQGQRRVPLEVIATPILNDLGEVAYAIAAFSDITERKQAQKLLADYNRTLATQVQERTDALTRQWEMLQTLVDRIPIMLAFYDAGGELILVNRAIEDTLGWSMAELSQADWLEQIYPTADDHQRALDHWETADGTWIDLTILDREERRVETTWAHIRLSDGRIIGIGQDITDRKRMEKSLRSQAETERLLSLITQHIRQSLDLAEILSTTVTEVQRYLKADRALILKFSPENTVRVIQSVTDPQYTIPGSFPWTPDCDLKACYENCLQGRPGIYPTIDANGCLSPFVQTLGVQTEMVAPILYPRGSEGNGHKPRLWGLLMVHACQFPRQWQPAEAEFLQQISNQLAIAIYQSDLYHQLQAELQEHRQTEAALRQSEARLTAAQAIANLGHWDLNAETGAMTWSDQLFEIAGLPGHQGAPGYTDFLAMCHPEDRDPLNQQVTNALAQGTPYRAVFRFIRPDQTIRHVESRAETARNAAGQVVRIFGTAQDISDRYEIDRLKDEFIGIVSHELRTPMTAIQSALMMLTAGAFDDDPNQAAQMLHIAQTNTERLVRLVNDVLDLERLESGKAELNIEPTPIADLVQDSIATLQPLANQAEVSLLWEPCPAQVHADPDAIIQTLTNLLSNAIKFSEPGSCVVVKARELGRDGAIEIAVADQGRGIPADQLESIFDRFHQVDALDSRQKGGTGLGLAICKTIVEQHGGQIWADSGPGPGSTFYFTLSLATGES
ncbi:MAG: AAA family ATPase [Nodosilinea sp.]